MATIDSQRSERKNVPRTAIRTPVRLYSLSPPALNRGLDVEKGRIRKHCGDKGCRRGQDVVVESGRMLVSLETDRIDRTASRRHAC